MPVATRASKSKKSSPQKSTLKRHFSKVGVYPFDEVGWKTVEVTVRSGNGTSRLRQLEFPEFWSDTATQIAGAKYFRGRVDSPEQETSAKQMISRVAQTIKKWGLSFGHLKNEETASVFEDELTAILLHQRAAFNSPVWFNMGWSEKPQCSACFILSVQDDMVSILDWIKTEGMIFKRGSGAGVNLSPLRSRLETLSQGGHASGPTSFMRGADSVAGMIASGGSTRRAAKMVVLNVDHPEVELFIRAKAEEEKKVRALIDAGYNMYDLNNEAWVSIQYQNANNSVRVTDEFMQAAENDESFSTRRVASKEIAQTYQARDLLRQIAQAAWECGDPGMQYDTIINNWHTCPNTGRINASNPCSEYMFLDDTACNLASINLLRYLNEDGTFDVKGFKHTVDVVILAQEIIVNGSSYPTPLIEKNSHEFRPLGLGYANLGAFLMSLGYAYDSDEARHTAGAITALMCGEAYRMSAQIAKQIGPFAGYKINREPFLRVIEMHKNSVARIRPSLVADRAIFEAAEEAWSGAYAAGEKYGFRNSQVTVLAPTGTIALMMDCATTGIEPEFALVKMKNLVGGGTIRFVNSTVPRALAKLDYTPDQVSEVVAFIETEGTIEGAPHIKDEHLSVFDCAVKPAKGKRTIHWQGHVKMVAAAQPFISGAISKTFNMSHDTTVEEIEKAYIMGWKLGLKAFAVYRDGSKAAQPLFTSNTHKGKDKQAAKPFRRRLPATRPSETHKFSIAGHEGFLTYSMFDDGALAEIFIRMSKQGSTLAGLVDVFSIAVSVALQYGVPLKSFATKFSFSRYEPAGYTENPDIRLATSITDYVFRFLAMRFLSPADLESLGIAVPIKEIAKEIVEVPVTETVKTPVAASVSVAAVEVEPGPKRVVYADSVCKACGGMLIQTGTCKTCIQCGTSNGGC